MSADKYFTYAAEVMKVNLPHITDEPIVARMRRIGIEVGRSFDFGKLDQSVQKALGSAPADAQALMKWKVATLARVVNYWSMNTDTMGVYGNYYLKRAMVTQIGLGANLPETRFILSISATRLASRSLVRTNISFTSTKASCRQSTDFGR